MGGKDRLKGVFSRTSEYLTQLFR